MVKTVDLGGKMLLPICDTVHHGRAKREEEEEEDNHLGKQSEELGRIWEVNLGAG